MNKQKILDISMPINEGMPAFPGDPRFKMIPFLSKSKGAPANVYTYIIGSHTGTHIDFQRHFINKGLTLKNVPLERLIGSCYVLNVSNMGNLITIDDLIGLPEPLLPKILLKTKNSKMGYSGRKRFFKGYTALGLEAAQYLVKKGIKTIGIDYLSIEEYKAKDHTVHKYLLKHNVVVIEGLELRRVVAGQYFLICLPLNIPAAEGSPARAILIEEV